MDGTETAAGSVENLKVSTNKRREGEMGIEINKKSAFANIDCGTTEGFVEGRAYPFDVYCEVERLRVQLHGSHIVQEQLSSLFRGDIVVEALTQTDLLVPELQHVKRIADLNFAVEFHEDCVVFKGHLEKCRAPAGSR